MLYERLLDPETILSSPLTGHRAWHECKSFDPDCGCQGHEQSCKLNREVYRWYYFERPPMARKKNKGSMNSVTFVRFELSAEDRKALPKFIKENEKEFDNLVNMILGANHKISLSFSEHNDSYICSVTGKPEDCDNANKCYTSHGKTFLMAYWVALYKYHVVWKGEVWEDLDDAEDFG